MDDAFLADDEWKLVLQDSEGENTVECTPKIPFKGTKRIKCELNDELFSVISSETIRVSMCRSY